MLIAPVLANISNQMLDLVPHIPSTISLRRHTQSFCDSEKGEINFISKINDRIVELGENCNLFAKCAILSREKTVGYHKLTSIQSGLMNSVGLLLGGGRENLTRESFKGRIWLRQPDAC